MAKLYIKTDANDIVIEANTEYFVNDIKKWILAGEVPGRHYTGNIQNANGVYLLKWDGKKIVNRPAADIEADNLKLNKIAKKVKIDNRTHNLIINGFDYNDIEFSLTLESQANWTSLFVKVNAGRFSPTDYPIPIPTKDDTIYNIEDEAALIAMYETGMTVKMGYVESGLVLKVRVNACTTQAELDAIHDDRT